MKKEGGRIMINYDLFYEYLCDSLMDSACYCVLTVMELDKK